MKLQYNTNDKEQTCKHKSSSINNYSAAAMVGGRVAHT
jgi:hypothetical protein